MKESRQPEPWLRGSLTDVPAIPRGVLHALELAREDLRKWCADLSEEELNVRPAGMGSVAFHIRHIGGSIDRLLTYAEGRVLSEQQVAALRGELEYKTSKEDLFAELETACNTAAQRIRALARLNFEEARAVGNKQLPATLGGLLVHVADHTQRHVGQAITTSKIVMAQRSMATPQP